MSLNSEFQYQPKISVIFPTFNTPENFLREAIQSVFDQIYPNWELCIADDASTQPHVRQVLEEYASTEARIKLVFRRENGHISRASNSALEIATGEFISLLDHDDLLTRDALSEVVKLLNLHPEADMIYSDEDKINEQNNYCLPAHKQDWCPDSFLSRMYTCHLGTYRRSLVNQIGGFRVGYEGSQDYDLVLRLTEKTNKIYHLPKILYHWRIHSGSASASRDAKPYAYEAAVKALTDALQRRGERGQVFANQNQPGHYTIRYEINQPKLVSIIIPTRDFGNHLNQCLESIFKQTSYPHYEVIVIDNGSQEAETSKIFQKWQSQEPSRFKVYPLDIPFNYSRLNNYGVQKAAGDYLLFLNNDTKITAENWLHAMVEQAQRSSIGAVGALLLYPNKTIQHAGIVLGVGGIASLGYQGVRSLAEYEDLAHIACVNNVSAVSGACLMCRRTVFEEVGGFDEGLPLVYNDVDLCLKMLAKGYRNIYVNHVQLYHEELRGWHFDLTNQEYKQLEQDASQLMQTRWQDVLKHDPCFSEKLVSKLNGFWQVQQPSPWEVNGQQPLVSICIPTYNGEQYVADALASVVAQTYKNLEIILSDDASTDRTVEIAQNFQAKHPSSFKIFTHAQYGLVENWNFCISQAKGKYIKLLCQDDWLEPNCIEALVDLAEKDEAIGLVFSRRGVAFTEESKGDLASQAIGQGAIELYKSWLSLHPIQDGKELLRDPNFLKNPINKIGEPSTVLIKKSVFDRVGVFDTELRQLVDVEMWFRIMSHSKIGFVNQVLSYWRIHLKQQTRENLLKGQISRDVSNLHSKILKSSYFNLLHPDIQAQMTQDAHVKEWMKQLAGETSPVSRAITTSLPQPLTIDAPKIEPLAPQIRRPFWSVMIPTYNRVKYLEQALKSVLQQAPSDTEMQIEVVNDCSDPAIQNEIEAVVKATGGMRVNFYQHPIKNIGQTAIFNLCIQRAQGYWVHILHDDDIVLPGFYERLRQGIETEASVGAAFCRHIYTDEVGNPRWTSWLERETPGILTNWLEQIIVTCRLQASPIVVKRSVYEQLGGFCPTAGAASDWEMWKRVAVHYPIWYEPQALAYYRQHDSSDNTRLMKSGGLIADVRRSIEISQTYLPSEIAEELSNKARENYAFYALNTAKQLLIKGEYEGAIAQIREGLKCSQSSPVKDALVSLLLPGESTQPSAGFSSEIQQAKTESVDKSPLDEFRKTRKQLAENLISLPTLEGLASAYLGEVGKTHQAILNSELKYEPLTDLEQEVLNQISSQLSQGFEHPKSSHYLLAAMLYGRADQLPIKYERAAIPTWLVNDYLKFMFASPSLFQEIGEADNYYRYLEGWLGYLYHNILSNSENQIWRGVASLIAQILNTIPIYFTQNNVRELYIKRAEILELSLKNHGFQVDYSLPPRPSNRAKIRVGILNDHFNPQTETFATLPVFEHWDRNQFEIILYALNVNGHPLEKYCESRADKLVALPQDLAIQVQTIRADDLDILFIGTNITAVNKLTASLAIHRLARIQATSLCSPTTTGMRHLDYYIAGTLTTPDASYQEQYREQLVTLEGCGFCFNYVTESEVATVQPTRGSLGISESEIVFISGANFFKILPELRKTWAKVLAQVPNSVLILYPFGPAWTRNYPATPFLNKMKAVLAKYGVDSNRLKLVRQLPSRGDVKAFLQLADIYLDSYPYAGATSLIDPLQVGLPTVVMEGKALRFRQGSAMLRSLAVPDLIANDEFAYIQIAVSLATHPEFRQQKRQEIQAKMQQNPPFLDSRTYSNTIGALFQKLFQQWQNEHQPSSPVLVLTPLEDRKEALPYLGQQFLNQLVGCVNLYHIDPSAQSVLADLQQMRKQFADFWLEVAPEKLEEFYLSEVGQGYRMLLNSGIQNQPLTETEQEFLQQLSQLSKGLVHPKAMNSLLAAMLYFAPGTMRVPDARTRLPKWLISDYEQVFESGAIAVNSDSELQVPTWQLQVQYVSSPPFLNQLLGSVNLYRIDPSDQALVLELRQIRKQIADFWLSVPPEQLETIYQSDASKGYKLMLSSGIANEAMIETEQAFLQLLATELGKGIKVPKAINHLLAAMLYCRPGQLQVQDAQVNLPRWFLEDYQKFVNARV